MGLSETEICNLALLRVGQPVIGDITEASDPAITCRKFYTETRDELLRQHPWNFAMGRKELAASTTTPDFEFTYSFPLPADCLRVLSLYYTDYEWVIEGKNLLTNLDTVQIKYIKRITDSGIFPPDFTEALSIKLAQKIAAYVTQNLKLSQLLYEEFEMVLARAKAADAQEGSYQAFETSTIINSRY